MNPDTLANIALSLPDHPTAAEILGALQRAYEKGFSEGVMSGQDYANKVSEMIQGVR